MRPLWRDLSANFFSAVGRSTGDPRFFHMFSTDPASRRGLTGPAAATTLMAAMPRDARRRFAILAIALLVVPGRGLQAADAVLYRVFLQDGSTLVSYGEY